MKKAICGLLCGTLLLLAGCQSTDGGAVQGGAVSSPTPAEIAAGQPQETSAPAPEASKADAVGEWASVYTWQASSDYTESYDTPNESSLIRLWLYDDGAYILSMFYSDESNGKWELIPGGESATVRLISLYDNSASDWELKDGTLHQKTSGFECRLKRVGDPGPRGLDYESFFSMAGEYYHDDSFDAPDGTFVNFAYSLDIEQDGNELVITNTWRGNDLLDHVRVGIDSYGIWGEGAQLLGFFADGTYHTLILDQMDEPAVLTLDDMVYYPVGTSPYAEDDWYEEEFEPSVTVPDGTENYFFFYPMDVGRYVVRNGRYVLKESWSWNNNRIDKYSSAGKPIVWSTDTSLPPVQTNITYYMPESFSATDCPYTPCSPNIINMKYTAAQVNQPMNYS